MNHSFNVLLGSECDLYTQEINYVFSEVANRIGCIFHLYTGHPSVKIDINYGVAPPSYGVHLKFYELSYGKSKLDYVTVGSEFLWAPKATRNASDVDLIGGIFRLLTMVDENHVLDSQRDKRGIFLVEHLSNERALCSGKPIVEYHVAEITKILKLYRPSFVPEENKYDGYRNALLLTHDTDATNLFAPQEILFNFVKSVYRFDKVRFKMFREGVVNFGSSLKTNPLYGFQGWDEYTKNKDIKSAFYLYARSKVRPTINDCRSGVQSNGFNWADLRRMSDEGNEFGLHPPINAKYSLDEFLTSKKYIEDKIQAPVYGLRHHYWALDWENPYKTHRLHENAGFRYDLSTAWRDRAGFRAGTCMPFKPWDPVRKRALNIYSIPLTVMDGHLMHSEFKELDAKEKLGQSVIDEVFTNNGVVVFDWHTVTICNTLCFQNYISVLDNIMVKLMSNDDLLVTTPFKLTKIWHERSHLFFSRLAS